MIKYFITMTIRETNRKLNFNFFLATNQLVNVNESCVGNANDLALYMHWLNSDNAESNTGQTPPSSNHRDPIRGNSFRNTARFNNGHASDNGSIGGSSNSSTLCQDTCQETTGFELDAGYDVVQQGLIGQGFYGEVFRGTMYHDGTSQEVAIKKLKTRAEASLHDFEREINIMKVNCTVLRTFFFPFFKFHYVNMFSL